MTDEPDTTSATNTAPTETAKPEKASVVAGSRDRYARIRRALTAHPWAIYPPHFDLVLEIVDRRIRGEDLARAEKDAAIAAAQDGKPAPGAAPGQGGGVLTLPVYGLIMHRARMVSDISGPTGTSTEMLGSQLTKGLRNPDVSAIVLDVDSPGGQIAGVEEFALQVFQARGVKPIIAVVNAMAGSAAYWIASQADEVVVTPSGEVGSVGVFMAHEDWSVAAEAEGLKVTFIHAGRYKVEGNDLEPLSDEAREFYQAEVDAAYDVFVKDVARGRGVKPAAVKKEYGEGRMVRARQAVEIGMADRLGTLSEVVTELSGQAAGKRRRARAASARLGLALST